MKILFLGDVMGRAGRAAIVERLPALRKDWALDFVVVNGENASSGSGLTGAHAKALLEAGADALTLGDHAFDQRDMLQFIETEPRVIRPINFAKGAPGRGAGRCALRGHVREDGHGPLVRRARVGLREKAEPMRRFVTGMVKGRFTPAMEEATLSGVYVETDDRTGAATRIEMVRQGGRLAQAGPV